MSKDGKGRSFGKETATWKLFVRYFLDHPEAEYPVLLGPFPKGKALNLAVGLNTCHCQHMRETGMPADCMLYSAKPLDRGDEWFVEISTNYTRTGQTRPSRKGKGDNWMDRLLEASSSPKAISPEHGQESAVVNSRPQEPTQAGPGRPAATLPSPSADPMEEILAKFLPSTKESEK